MADQTTKKELPVDIVKADEPWIVLHLADGTVLKVRFVINEVRRVVGEFLPNGEPSYKFDWNMVATVKAPEKLKKQ